jgi:hypothetical protein
MKKYTLLALLITANFVFAMDGQQPQNDDIFADLPDFIERPFSPSLGADIGDFPLADGQSLDADHDPLLPPLFNAEPLSLGSDSEFEAMPAGSLNDFNTIPTVES